MQTVYFTFHTKPELLIEVFDTAADILLTLAGPETYLAFTAGRGWSHEQYLGWAGEAIPRLLVPNSAEPVPAVP